MHSETPAYGLWSLVVLNAAVFIIFAFSFTHPRSARTGARLGLLPLFWWRCLPRCMASR
jgi:methanethiol S-methyltransferase